MSIKTIMAVLWSLGIWPFLAAIFAGLVLAGQVHGPWNYYWFFAMGCWFVLDAYWVMSARATKLIISPTQYRTAILNSFLIHALYCLPFGSVPIFGLRILPPLVSLKIFGATLCALGVGFAIWARHILSGNWNAAATLQERHALVQSGPYAIVRHPIYLGFLLTAAGMFLALGEVRALACLCHASNFIKKLRQEESLLRTAYPEDYPEYEKKVKRLLPCIW